MLKRSGIRGHRNARSGRPGGVARAMAILCCAVSLIGVRTPSFAAADSGEAATIDRLFARVSLVRKEIELVRLEMGKPHSEPTGIVVSKATSREVFFAARNVLDKANRLGFEIAREMAPSPEAPLGDILPFDVSVIVTAALMRIRQVKAELGIQEQSPEPLTLGARTASEVFVSLLEASRQLDLLLDHPIGPSDVFQQVTLAVGYAARLLARFPGQSRIPEAPSLERHKVPADVFRRLLLCFDLVREIARRSRLDILELHTGDRGLSWVASGDNYELASLIVGELAYLHVRLPNPRPPRQVYYPGRKFPSHVHQRAGILEAQLRNLSRRVARNPQWLSRGGD